MALIQFITLKKDDSTYQVVGVRSADSSDTAIISEHRNLDDAHRAWRRLECLPQAPFSDIRERVFDDARRDVTA